MPITIPIARVLLAFSVIAFVIRGPTLFCVLCEKGFHGSDRVEFHLPV
jgi:hypothetical protein